jgi:hypothetical protein
MIEVRLDAQGFGRRAEPGRPRSSWERDSPIDERAEGTVAPDAPGAETGQREGETAEHWGSEWLEEAPGAERAEVIEP